MKDLPMNEESWDGAATIFDKLYHLQTLLTFAFRERNSMHIFAQKSPGMTAQITLLDNIIENILIKISLLLTEDETK